MQYVNQCDTKSCRLCFVFTGASWVLTDTDSKTQ